ncbi:hypothetical protein [Lachnoclostridium sp. Marseille-P6806]|uniref:hypothetical protein n=1 Tax=Lachnoclostridium sp. Marseille-P6806 TaxID=2364793 RepID=UPI00102F6E72|nr:hypothetical protein [Lachnoclostridium sp. Marseille-P6806]
MAQLQEYKCPCCGGGIHFDSSIQKMKCPYCGTEFELETLKVYDEALREPESAAGGDADWDMAGEEWASGEQQGLRVYHCRSCGAEIVADETLASSKCPYCDNPIVMMGQFSGGLKPDCIIPFKLDREAAKQALRKHCGGKKLLPRIFLEENHIDELKGVYVPVWLFDAEALATIRYRAEKEREWDDDRFRYKETSYYTVLRGGSLTFESVPVDGSGKMDDALMESVEPYDSREAVPFQTAYLAGYLADKYDVDSETSRKRADERIRRSTEEAFRKTVTGYSRVEAEDCGIRLNNAKARYALYPVWLLNTSWNGGKYVFCMNGQTGKLVGDLPMDKGLLNRYRLISGAAAAVLAFAVSALIWLL